MPSSPFNRLRYNQAMRGPMAEKLFFHQHLNADVYVDFGCADGSLLKTLHETGDAPEATYIGYDICPHQRALAKSNFPQFAEVYTSLDDLRSHLHKLAGKRSCLILSSVVHEATDGSDQSWQSFWGDVVGLGCDVICLRDMSVARRACLEPPSADMLAAVEKHARWAEFRATCGPNLSRKDCLHFLLKYRYEAHWPREVAENYLPFAMEDLCARIDTPPYRLTFLNHYSQDFLRDKVAADFGLTIHDATHVQAILERL